MQQPRCYCVSENCSFLSLTSPGFQFCDIHTSELHVAYSVYSKPPWLLKIKNTLCNLKQWHMWKYHTTAELFIIHWYCPNQNTSIDPFLTSSQVNDVHACINLPRVSTCLWSFCHTFPASVLDQSVPLHRLHNCTVRYVRPTASDCPKVAH